MNKSEMLIGEIRNYINKAMELRPQYTRDLLLTEGTDEVIFYMNGNDGTEFDWSCNGRACEFMVFFKETEMGYIKVYVNDDDTLSGYLYESDYKYGDKPLKLEPKKLNDGDAKYVAALMDLVADRFNKWDQSLDKFDFVELKKYEVDNFCPEDEEEEEW